MSIEAYLTIEIGPKKSFAVVILSGWACMTDRFSSNLRGFLRTGFLLDFFGNI
jgi:hypothetical protein